MKTTQLRTNRVLEWVDCGSPRSHLVCFVDGCESEWNECRDTLEGVYCLEHFMELGSCSKCGKAGTVVQHQRGFADGSTVCRSCYCGDVSNGYVDGQRTDMITPKSGLCEAAGHIYDWTDVFDAEPYDG